jgi:hypothetical protein
VYSVFLKAGRVVPIKNPDFATSQANNAKELLLVIFGALAEELTQGAEGST